MTSTAPPTGSERLRAAASLYETAALDPALVVSISVITGAGHGHAVSMQGDPRAIKALAVACGAIAEDDEIRVSTESGYGYLAWAGTWEGVAFRLTEAHEPQVSA